MGIWCCSMGGVYNVCPAPLWGNDWCRVDTECKNAEKRKLLQKTEHCPDQVTRCCYNAGRAYQLSDLILPNCMISLLDYAMAAFNYYYYYLLLLFLRPSQLSTELTSIVYCDWLHCGKVYSRSTVKYCIKWIITQLTS